MAGVCADRHGTGASTDQAMTLQPITAMHGWLRHGQGRTGPLHGLHQPRSMIRLAAYTRHGNMPARVGVTTG